jgi:hypothetical protein
MSRARYPEKVRMYFKSVAGRARNSQEKSKKKPSEYEAKAKKADEAFGAPGSTAVLGALRAIPTVRGIALGALGVFSESINVLIQGLAHEGALKNPDKFGQSNYKAAYGQIHWLLKHRRLAWKSSQPSRRATPASGTLEAPPSSRLLRSMPRPRPRATGAKVACTASAKKKLPLPSLGGSVADKPLWLPASSSVCSLLALFSESSEPSLYGAPALY